MSLATLESPTMKPIIKSTPYTMHDGFQSSLASSNEITRQVCLNRARTVRTKVSNGLARKGFHAKSITRRAQKANPWWLLKTANDIYGGGFGCRRKGERRSPHRDENKIKT
jgi:hypothetical protein